MGCVHGRGLQIHPALSKLALVLVSAVLAACGPVIVTPPSATPTPNLEASFAGLFLGSLGIEGTFLVQMLSTYLSLIHI